MFKKLKEKTIESSVGERGEDRGTSPLRHVPGLAIRTPLETQDTSLDTSEHVDNSLLTEYLNDENVTLNNDETSKKDTREESILQQLTSELVTLRRQYNTVLTDKQHLERESSDTIQSLQTSLTEKEEMVRKMERKITELTWSVDSLSSRLQMYSNYEKEDIIKKLQTQVFELEARLHQRDLDIEIYETRVAAQSKQRHEEQMSHKKKTHGLKDTMTSLQTSVLEKDQRLHHLNSEVLKIRSSLSEVEKKRQELENLIEEQKINLNEKDQRFEEQVNCHGEELERMKKEHLKEINELHEQIKLVKNELKDKENKLERLLSQLPHEPVINTVLDGYSKTKMADTFELSLRTPGGVYRKEVEPLSRPDPNAPPILPIEETTPTNYTESQFNPQYEVQLMECKRYNEMLEEELEEKNKTIRLQQQKLVDMKKALVNKDKPVPPSSLPLFQAPPTSLQAPPALIQAPSITQKVVPSEGKNFVIASDINFQYLKNVIIRFICTREDEALQLVKAVSTLLELNNDEEKYIRDYLLYKLSWFGTVPAPPASTSDSLKNN